MSSTTTKRQWARLFAAALIAMALLGGSLAEAEAYSVPPPWGVGESKGEDLKISLATFSPGPDVPSWFGHGAMVVEDTRLGVSRLYNYGMFSFNQAMIFRFAM
ncbi:MAG: hypothetical protein ACNA8W_12290, partial [Bradymonadaceae bacterium]